VTTLRSYFGIGNTDTPLRFKY